MFTTFSQFDKHKLRTEFYDVEGYCKHTITRKSETGPSATIEEEVTEEWSRGKFLGRGAFGAVWLEKEEKGALRAVKQISKVDIRNTRELLALIKLNAVNTFPLTFRPSASLEYRLIMSSIPSFLCVFSDGSRTKTIFTSLWSMYSVATWPASFGTTIFQSLKARRRPSQHNYSQA